MIHTNIIEVLRQRALQQPEKVAYTFLEDGEDKETNLTYGQLDRQARSIAALLNRHQVYERPVLLLYPSGLDYIASFFGCLYAGAIAVPAYPPQHGRSLSRLYSVLTDAQPAAVLTSEAIRSGIDLLPGEHSVLKALNWIATDNLEIELAERWQNPAITGDTVAFLQYTSGSTSSPKGVIVTHSNLLHNEEMIRSALGHTEQSTFVGWLPLYHDMGLIGNVLQPLYIGAHCVLMSPEAFLQKPYRWLKAISRYRGVTSGGPNFAYELCARKVRSKERATLDLSSWANAFNGAEPVRHETIDRFASAFASCGFRRETFYPCYGLAEATLFVSGEQKPASYSTRTVQKAELERNIVTAGQAGEPGVQTIVSCGSNFSDQKIAIVDPNALTLLASGQVGEIWIAGPSVTRGYWGRPEETGATFRTYIKDTGEGPFLRTGDLGFLLDGNLFVTGRLKDLVILRGRNHYPQDIELTVERSHKSLRPGRGAAFSVEAGGEERLVVVQEVDSGASQEVDSIVDHIRQAIAKEHEIQAYAILLVTPGSVPKTSSGKLQRQACREAYLNGKLDKINEWQSGAGGETIPASASPHPQSLEEVEAWLQSSIASSLKVDRAHLDMAKPLAALGADSLTTIEIMHLIETELGISLSISELLQCASISRLAAETFSRLVTNAPAVVRAAKDEIPIHPLSYGQRSLFFLNQLQPTGSAYNIARAVRVVGDLNTDHLNEAFHKLVERHAALRTTFAVKDGEPIQQIHPHMEILFQRQEVFEWEEKDLEEHLVREADQPFDLAKGPLLRVKLFALQPQRHVMLLVIHHIISDFWSLAVLMN